MKTEKEINADILKMIMKIDETYPELSKYIAEMKVSISDTDTDFPETNLINLADYYNSLCALFTRYKRAVPSYTS